MPADTPVATEPVVDIADQFDAEPDIADDLDAAETTKPQEEAKPPGPAKQKYKLKINGLDEEVELSQEELTAWLQKAKVADQRFNEAGLAEKKAQELYRLFKESPYEALRAMGHDPEKLAQDLVYAKAKRSIMTKDEQQLASVQEELERLREKDKQYAEKEQQAEVAAIESRITRDIDACLDKNKLPKSREFRRHVVNYLAEADRLGYEATPDDVLSYAVADYKKSLEDTFGQMESAQLLEFLGAGIAEKIRKYDIGLATKPFTNVVKKGDQPEAKPKQKSPKFFSPDEFVKSL